MEVKVIGQMDNTIDHTFESANRVYDVGGCAPTMNTCGGGGLQPKILVEPKCLNSKGGRAGIEGLQPSLQDRVYSADAVSVAVTTAFMPSILETVKIKQATKDGYIECEVGGVADLSFPDSNTRRGRVQDKGNTCPTLMAGEQDICRIEKEVEDEERSSVETLRILRKEIGEKDFSEWAIRGLWCVLQEEVLRQNVYAKGIYENWTHRPELFKFAYNSKGDQYSIYSEKSMRNMWKNWKDGCTSYRRGLPKQQCREFDDFVSELPYETTQRKKFVYCLWETSKGIGLLREALSEIQKIWESTPSEAMQRCAYRIRKLTPLSCWRLMDFTDEDFEKAAQVNSNTQLYKQAGNSIVRNVLVAILGQMIPGKEAVYKQ